MKEFLILIAMIPVVAAVIDFLLAHSLLGRRYRWFVAPGVVAHEASHALACLITGTKISHMSFFDKEGGRVEHHPSPIPIFGQLLISLAPFILGTVALYFLAHFVGVKGIVLSDITPSYAGISAAISHTLYDVNLSSTKNIIIIYLLLSIAVTMNPSLQDIKNILVTLIFFGGSAFIIWHYTSFRPHLNIQIPAALYTVVSTVDILLILCLILSIVIFVFSRLIKPV